MCSSDLDAGGNFHFQITSIFCFSLQASPKNKKKPETLQAKQAKERMIFSAHAKKTKLYFSSPIQTILSVLESHQILRQSARGLYRRSGISPCPEETIYVVMSHTDIPLRHTPQKKNPCFFAARMAFIFTISLYHLLITCQVYSTE